MQLSPRRKRIARGDMLVPEARRRRMLTEWAADGFDVSEFVGLLQSMPPCDLKPPANPVAVDVVVPFCETDRIYVAECVSALVTQEHVDVRVHLINDGTTWPELPAGQIVRYKTPGGLGPYRITNAIYHNLTREFVALNDADDISLPGRLWSQVQLLRYYQADMISSGMENFLPDGEDRPDLVRKAKSPELLPGRIYKSTPLGSGINGTRMFRRELFDTLNGFADEACGMDHDFDNRARFTGAVVVDDKVIRARRRLRSDSLSNGGEYQLGSDARKATALKITQNLERLTADATLETAFALGGLDAAAPIDPLPPGMHY